LLTFQRIAADESNPALRADLLVFRSSIARVKALRATCRVGKARQYFVPAMQKTKRRPGRPSIRTRAIEDRICTGVANGESMTRICRDVGMPEKATVFRWLAEDPAFQNRYRIAKEMMAEAMAEDILAIADDDSHDTIETKAGVVPNREWIERSKVRCDNRRWLMSKLLPKKYGDKAAIEHSGAVATGMTLAELDERIAKAKGEKKAE
jgi:hypothetical protein